jgi:hypothetical protein
VRSLRHPADLLDRLVEQHFPGFRPAWIDPAVVLPAAKAPPGIANELRVEPLCNGTMEPSSSMARSAITLRKRRSVSGFEGMVVSTHHT